MTISVMGDEAAMRLAIAHAHMGAMQGHRPFGCVIFENMVLATAFGTESATDPTRHSEMLAIRDACTRRSGLLRGCTLVSTHEPCHMCCGAIKHAHVSRVVYGTCRTDLPGLFRVYAMADSATVLCDTGHPPRITSGFMREECLRLFDDELEALRQRTRRLQNVE